jgi:hypothetical protein
MNDFSTAMPNHRLRGRRCAPPLNGQVAARSATSGGSTMVGFRTALLLAVFGLGLGGLRANPANAHCDGLDGPVVKAAQEALAKGDVDLVLIWVQASDEAEMRRAFDRTMNVRKLGPQAQELADTYFFETLGAPIARR